MNRTLIHCYILWYYVTSPISYCPPLVVTCVETSAESLSDFEWHLRKWCTTNSPIIGGCQTGRWSINAGSRVSFVRFLMSPIQESGRTVEREFNTTGLIQVRLIKKKYIIPRKSVTRLILLIRFKFKSAFVCCE